MSNMHRRQKFAKLKFYSKLVFSQILKKIVMLQPMTKRAQTLLISLDCGCNTLNMVICFLCANKPWCDQRSSWNDGGSYGRNGRKTEPGESFNRPLDVIRRSKPDAILVTLSFFIVMREQRGAASATRPPELALPRWCHQSGSVQNKQNTDRQTFWLFQGRNHLSRLNVTVTSRDPFRITHRS